MYSDDEDICAEALSLLSATQKKAGTDFQSRLCYGNTHRYVETLSLLSATQKKAGTDFQSRLCYGNTHRYVETLSLLSATQKEAGTDFQSRLCYGNAHRYVETLSLLSATQKEAGIYIQICLYYGNSHRCPALSNAEGSRYLLSKLSVLWKFLPLSCSQQHRRKQVFTFKVVCMMETPTFILLSATQKEAGIYFQSCLYDGNSHLYPAFSNTEGSRYLLSKLSV